MVIEGYEILGDNNLPDLNRQIRHWRDMGYEPHGYAFAAGAMVCQAMIKIRVVKDDLYAALGGASLMKEMSNGKA